jgi:hypothetical protein
MSRSKKKPTTIAVYPGIEIVAQPGAPDVVLSMLKRIVDDELRADLVQEQIANLLSNETRSDDRYAIARLLMEKPERLEQIVEAVRKARAS